MNAMPELPEVETVRLGLEKTLKNKVIKTVTLRRGGLRAPFPDGFAARLQGQRLERFRRRAKYLLMELSGGDVWLAHLGMSGSFRAIQGNTTFTPEAHDHVILTFDCGMRLVYNDPRRFGQMDVFRAEEEAVYPALSKIGPEPISPDFDGVCLAARLKGKKGPIKTILLQQEVVAGIGNIYACEALYKAGIHPERAANSIRGQKAAALANAIRAVMEAALKSGGSTLRDHRLIDGSTGYFQHAFAVYGLKNKACGECTCGNKSSVACISQAGRSTFFCPVKQR